MPPQTKLPRPAGHVQISYDPMSPGNWGIVPANLHTFVYPNVKIALKALLQAATTIQAQRLEADTASLFSDHIYFRGQKDVAHRLLPTRLRGQHLELVPRGRRPIPAGPPGNDPREQYGDWYEYLEPMRSIEDSIAELSEEGLQQRDKLEAADIIRAAKIPAIAGLDDFLKRAAVRHYSGAPSGILDISTNPEVAAFFATGGGSKAPTPGQLGMLWAIDLNFLAGLFSFEISSIPDGVRIRLREARNNWGDNKKMFEDQGILPACLELTSVALPFQRPLAQHARFFSLTGENGEPLPLKTEMTWWSIIERRAYMCAFVQDGNVYENSAHNITQAALLPDNEPLAIALK